MQHILDFQVSYFSGADVDENMRFKVSTMINKDYCCGYGASILSAIEQLNNNIKIKERF